MFALERHNNIPFCMSFSHPEMIQISGCAWTPPYIWSSGLLLSAMCVNAKMYYKWITRSTFPFILFKQEQERCLEIFLIHCLHVNLPQLVRLSKVPTPLNPKKHSLTFIWKKKWGLDYMRLLCCCLLPCYNLSLYMPCERKAESWSCFLCPHRFVDINNRHRHVQPKQG